MIVDFEASPLFLHLQRLVENLGYVLVEASSRQKAGDVQVHLVIHHPEGIDHRACARVSRAVMASLEEFFDSREVTLEVSSPGLERNLKTWREFEVFRGLPAKVCRRDGTWESVRLGPELIGTDIVKAKLDGLGGIR